MTTLLVQELGKTIDTIHSKLPWSMLNPKNAKLAANLQGELGKYFYGLAVAFPYERLADIYKQHVKEALPAPPTVNPGDWDWLNNLLRWNRGQLLSLLSTNLSNTYISGSMSIMSYGTTKLGWPNQFEGPPWSAAVKWAEEYSAQLVTGMDEETRRQLAQVISDGIENKRGVEGIARDIRSQFEDMSKSRSMTIADTESNRALSKAAMDKMHDYGVDGKQWLPHATACDICHANGDQGVIPIDQEFESGDMEPPNHPNCYCALSPAMLSSNEDMML